MPLLVLTLAGCASSRLTRLESRMATLEKQSQLAASALDQHALRTDSVIIGMEKLSERVDAIVPPNAQWLRLAEGSALKWYVDEEIQNIYVQYAGPGPDPASVQVSISDRDEPQTHVLRPGMAIEYVRADAEGGPRRFAVTLHRLLLSGAKDRYAQFSLREQPSTGQ